MFDQEAIQSIIGYRFKDIGILERALTHSSYAHMRKVDDYQRLEFLGDSILNFLIAEELFRRYPDAEEGEMSKLRMAIVSSSPLAALVRKKGYDGFLRMGFGDVGEKICADIFESICAAIYLDGGMEKAREFVISDLADAIDHARENSQKDYKTALYEKFPDRKIIFEDAGQSGELHCPIFEVNLYIDGKFMASGKGGSKKAAQRNCAKEVLERID